MSSAEQPRILTVTLNPTVDLSFDVQRLVSGGKNRAHLSSVQAGGGGINVARCLARLGVPAVSLHTSGLEVGHRLNRLLDEEGLLHRGIDIETDTREAVVIGEEWSGHSYHVVPPGPRLSEAEAARCLAAIVSAARDFPYLVLTGSATPGLRDDFSADIVRSAHADGITTVLDIAGNQLRKALQEKAFLIRLDRTEAGALIGRAIEDFADARAANQSVLDTGATDNVVTTVGALGAVYSNREFHHEISAPPLSDPVRSDACAGDSLVAALTSRLAVGDSCLRACEYGVAAAAATVMLPGTRVFERDIVDQLGTAVRTRQIRRSRPTE
ncbi:1-phosphofructokinase family hexose kinase [Nocardia xishanensis]|uniref:1-phosphofructokinase family hexose kinase n=1 Tax=Nocardia xishanensis TaxID=238964 RepID=UPI000A7BF636|nr:1-phosphofructokinase family hexose kinase [Nocardia xishanensis]